MKYILLFLLVNFVHIPVVYSQNQTSSQTYILAPKRMTTAGQSRISFADARNKANENIPSNYAVQKVTYKKIGGIYYCYLVLIKVS